MDLKAGATVTLSADASRPEQVHVFEGESVLAVRAAMAACRPLLVRGEPGVGKTQLAAAAAKALGRVLVPYVVDSRTESRTLLWEFDAVMRLAEAQLLGGLKVDNKDKEQARMDLSPQKFLRPGPLWWAFNWKSAEKQAKDSNSVPPPIADGCDPQNGCVLLIDEIDKAESDVPNGLLEVLGSGQFTPFAHTKPVLPSEPAPLVIITTNNERILPDAFLRRCLVFEIRIPKTKEDFIKLMTARGEEHFRSPLTVGKTEYPPVTKPILLAAAELVWRDRQSAISANERPLPGQAEYLDLIRAVLKMAEHENERLDLLKKVALFTLSKHTSTLP